MSQTLSRRDFFATLGSGIVVVMLIEDEADAQESGGGARRGFTERLPEQIGAWLHVGEDDTITVFTGKVEVGQNARTSLTQAVAEELRAPVASIRLVMGDTSVTPYDMGTFGSRTTPTMWPQLRKVAATAREMLLDIAAQKWEADRKTLSIANGRVSAGKHSTGFGELMKGQQLTRTITSSATLTPATEWKLAGTSVPKVNGRDMVTGRHKYAYDMSRPGMLWGKVLYPPSFGATLVSLDAASAKSMPGVTVVREGDFVGVAAPDSETAERAVNALRAQWKELPGQPASGPGLSAYFESNSSSGRPASPNLTDYTIAYIAHTPLEPRAAVAEWDGGKLTVWTGTQRPFGVRSELAAAFHLGEDEIRVIMPDTGSGYGGKHTGDAAIEAARLAKAAGRPVKRNWTREEEFTWAYARPGGVIRVAGEVAADGRISAWEFHNYNSGPSGLQTPYHVPGAREQYHESKTPLRQGSYRGLAATANHFARECYMDELAYRHGIDPLEFRLRNAADERLRAVIEAAVARFGWKDRNKGAGRGFGIAAGLEKGGYVAACAEISVDPLSGAVHALRVTEAFECGAVVNPDQLRNQIEGAIVMGLGGALFEQIEFADGRLLNGRLSKYRVPRFTDMPQIEAVLLDRKDIIPAGAGETPIVGIAPAVGNAIFDATGQRIRALPLAPNGLKLG